MRLAAVVLLILLLPAVLSFAVDGRTNVHVRLTRDALPFLRSSVLDEIAETNKNEDDGDKADLPERHFTNCLFAASVEHINARYRGTAGELFKGNSRLAARDFGALLHTAQDFYAHSGWVDSTPVGLGFGGPRGRNVEDGVTWWAFPGPYEPLIDDIVIVEGEPPRGATIVLPRDSQAHPASVVPIVTIEGRRYRGLMTSTANPISFATAHCPPPGHDCWDEESVCIRHGEPNREKKKVGRVIACIGATSTLVENCFHHDEPRRPQFDDAFAAALRQTRHEWCRLLHLSRQTDTTLHAVGLLLGVWVRPPPELPDFATPHPVGTACAPTEPASIAVSVRLTAVTGGNGDKHFALAIYTRDLQRSARAHRERRELLGDPLVLCIDEQDDVIVALWGWEGGKDFEPDRAVDGVSSRLSSLDLPAPGATISRAATGPGGMRIGFEVSRPQVPC